MLRSEPSQNSFHNTSCTLSNSCRQFQIPKSNHTMPLCIAQRLLLLGTATAGLLGELDALLVGLDVAGVGATHHATEATSGLPGTLELANSGSAEEVNLDEVALESALEGNDGLDEEGVGVVEVKVHDAHHADTHELGLEETAQLLLVVGVDGGGDDLGLLGAAHGGGLDVLHDGHVCWEEESC